MDVNVDAPPESVRPSQNMSEELFDRLMEPFDPAPETSEEAACANPAVVPVRPSQG